MSVNQIEPGQDWLKNLNNDLSQLANETDYLSSLDNKYQNRTYHALGLNGWKVEGEAGVIDNFPEKGKRVLWVTMSITSLSVTNQAGRLQELVVGKINSAFDPYSIPSPNWRNSTIGLVAVGMGDSQNEIHLHTMGGEIDVGSVYHVSSMRIEDMS